MTKEDDDSITPSPTTGVHHDVENPLPSPSDDYDDGSSCTEPSPPASSSTFQYHPMERRRGEIAARRLYSNSSSAPGAAAATSSTSTSTSKSKSKSKSMTSKEEKQQGVTVFARHRIKPGKEKLLEAWIQQVSQLQQPNYPGFGGVQVVRPTTNCNANARNDNNNEYVSIFRYDNYDLLRDFMNSKDRRRLYEQTYEFAAAPIELTYHSLEYWFTDDTSSSSPGGAGAGAGGDGADHRHHQDEPPSKPKMVVVTFLLIWFQAHFMGPALGRLIPGIMHSPLALEALTIFLVVLGTTYLWMPITTRYILHWWLFPARPAVASSSAAPVVVVEEGDRASRENQEHLNN
jgi:antibiotic biosynthesis monooxygenase (ABM) superfamily enzyme